LVVIFGVGYMFFIRPRSQAARRQRDTLMELSAGDEVLTGAGIFGTVLDVESDRVTLETAPGTRITVLRSTIARRIPEVTADTRSWDEHDEDEAHGAYQDYEHDHDDKDTDDEDGHDEADEHDVAGDAHDEDAHDPDAHDADATDEVDEHHDDAASDTDAGAADTEAEDGGAAHPGGTDDKKKT
jgi:preprotein translocase subunit YajC